MQFWPSRLKYYLQQREKKFSFNWSTCVLITVFDWFCSYAWNKETPNIWIKKSFGSFNLVMSSWRGWPTTTGWNHNKRSNTYASKKIVRELILEKKTKTTSTLVTTFFKPLSSDGQAKVTNADTTTNCSETACSDSTCSEDSVSNLSLKLHKCPNQNLLKPNGTVLILILNQYRVQTHQKYPRKIVFTWEPEVQL